jgi:hypothetical protein
MLKAFVDDSGSGGDSPWYVLAGYLGSVADWDAFDPEWQAVLDSPPKIEYFKHSEAQSLKGQFAGFSLEQRNARLDSFIQVIQRRARHALHIRLKQKHYNRIISANGLPDTWDNPYYFLFSGFIFAALGFEKYFGDQGSVEFVFDSSQQFEKPSLRLYGQMDALQISEGKIMNVLYRDEKSFLPLQAADLLAWEVRRRFCVSGVPDRPQFEGAQACAGIPPCHNRTLNEADLYDVMLATKENERKLIEQHGMGKADSKA